MTINDIKGKKWVKFWASAWSLTTCSDWGYQYTNIIKVKGKMFLDEAVLVAEHGKSAGYAKETRRVAWGKHLAREVTKNPKRAQEICNHLKTEADQILAFLKVYEKKKVTGKVFEEYIQRCRTYYTPHVNVKFIVDFLTPAQLKKHLHDFEDARIYAEPVFRNTELFLRRMCKMIAKDTGYTPEMLRCLTIDEVRRYFASGKLPAKSELLERDKLAVMLFDKKSITLLTGALAGKARNLMVKPQSGELRGTTAYPGKVLGTVRVVLHPNHDHGFQPGDILVAGSTRPQYLPLMKKAAAFVTDSGGILSHAAIVAREMKKPCVIGTQTATQVLKDGDRVEVDASSGVVKLL